MHQESETPAPAVAPESAPVAEAKRAPRKTSKKKTPAAAAPTVSERQGYIGGSDAAALLGLSPYSSPMQVFAQKTGRDIKLPPDPQREALFYFGHLLEEPIGRAVQHRYKLDLQRPPEGFDFFRSKKYPWMAGHIDFLFSERDGFLECKNIRYPGAWGEMLPDPLTMDGSHLIPDYYLCQCLHYMVVLDCDKCYIAALIGGSDLRLYLITRAANQPLIDEIILVEERFWKKNILSDDPPESIHANDLLLRRQMFPVGAETPKQIPATAEVTQWLQDLTAARARAKKAEREAEKLRNSIILAAQGAAQFVNAEGEAVGYVGISRKEVFDPARMHAAAPVAFSIYQLCMKEQLYFLVKESKKETEED